MRVISLVPSWTETLIEAGVDVVGRTRYCIHPEWRITTLPIVGGTKDVSWEKVKALDADLLLLDQEENPKRFAQESPIPTMSTHVHNIRTLGVELQHLGRKFQNDKLLEYGVQAMGRKLSPELIDWSKLPGVIEWWRPPEVKIERVLYMIWKSPWMCVSRQTYIGSVLTTVGVGKFMPEFKDKYPKITLEEYASPSTLILFSSEPYAFAKEKEQVMELKSPMALVNGECFSWFGLRGLKFLASLSV